MLNRSLASLLVLPLLACGDNLSQGTLSIHGVTWNDVDKDGVFDEGEQPIEGVVVFLDSNDDKLLGEDETRVQSDRAGRFVFEGLEPGDYIVRQDLPFGWRPSDEVAAMSAASPTFPRAPKGAGIAHIIGGSDADVESYPFMASVGQFSGERFYHSCGGALISDRFVLTAAHCSEGAEASDVSVMLGTSDLEEGKVVSVKAITLHPEWVGDTAVGFDMALWELSERLDLQGLGLHSVDMLTPATRELAAASRLSTTIGWGRSDNESERLQEVHVPIASEEACARAYPGVRSFQTQICAGAIDGGLDSCQGDSGGPLLVRDQESGRWMHAGVTSWGHGCGQAEKPGIYGRTSEMSEWAMQQITESSTAYLVQLKSKDLRLEFPNQPTTRALVSEIAPRWALSQIDLSGVEDDKVNPNTPMELSFFLFTESFGSELEFDCRVDQDGAGSMEGDGFSCQGGINRVVLEGYSDGAYSLNLAVEAAGRTKQRERLIVAGSLTESELDGSLAVTDASDPDYPSTYYIDYYELSDAEVGSVALVEVDAGFGIQLGLYDADVRNSVDGGGALDIVTGNTLTSLNFVPQEGRRYLVGISSLGTQVTGEYTIRVRNNGTPTPATL